MSCKSPLLRIKPEYAEDFPPHYSKQIKQNNGLIIGQNHLDYVSQFLSLSHLQQVPCGHCVPCMLKKSRDWGVRIMLECKEYPHNYFITLTYDEDHLPKSSEGRLFIDYEGEVFDTQLELKDFQDFMKRFRDHVSREYGHSGMRIAYCGEYGGLTKRPHFHFILMNAPDLADQLQFFRYKKVDGERINYYKSPFIDRIWSKGFTEVTTVSFNAAAYVAGYVLKKQYAKDFKPIEIPEDFSLRTQPFFRVSNRPGIARRFFDDNYEDIYSNDEIFIKKRFSLMKVRPPRYYDKLFDILEPDKMAQLKETREREVRLDTDLGELEYKFSSGERLERKHSSMKGRNSSL